MFDKVLIANRGEIALRVIRACRELGVRAVAVYSDVDRDALHVRQAFEAHPLPGVGAAETYLRGDRIIDIALRCGAEAIHPGYGFLSENAEFAKAVEDAGLVFIGPTPEAIGIMGDKLEARRTMREAGVPIVPGTVEALSSADEAVQVADEVGFPVMLKAVAGGGGKGMRLVAGADEIPAALERARSEARSAFADDRVYLEKALSGGRHVEVQVLSDGRGLHLHLFERDCSLQRRHQKVLEESPSPGLDRGTAQAMARVAVQAAAAVDYRGAGTVEFLLAADGSFYFLEMNTRLQVEHPVTEMITGIDLAQAQLQVAAGEELGLRQEDIRWQGHAIECRIYAEDPDRGFRPSPGRIETFRLPGGPWVRVDSGVLEGSEVSIHYDPMVAKLVVWGRDRPAALARARRALREFRVTGVATSIPFFLRLLDDPGVVAGTYDTRYLERIVESLVSAEAEGVPEVGLVAAAVAAFLRDEALRGLHATAATPDGGNWWRRGLAGRER
jgi:acetyl-CoA carboxylase biotin carboxylase subunit